MNVTASRRPVITLGMRGSSIAIWLLAVACGVTVACTRERSRTVSAEENDAAAEGPRDYREMLTRARLKQSTALILSDMETAIHRFQFELARLPTNLHELVGRGYLPEIPAPPPGQTYSYDPVHGNVSMAEIPDGSGIQLPAEITNATPVRLQEVPLPEMPQ